MGHKILTPILQLSILGFTWALVWFSFVYYPKVLKEYQQGIFPKKQYIAPVSAQSRAFPIDTNAYRITYEETTQTYYVVTWGKTLPEYLTNRDQAKLALKSTLSQENLCQTRVVYLPAEKLTIPQELADYSDCQN